MIPAMLYLLLWAGSASAECPTDLPADVAADPRSAARLFVVWKLEHEMAIYRAGALISPCYRIKMAGGYWNGPKQREET